MASKKITCPYCFKEFQNTEAYYQCESEERDRNGDYKCERISTEEYDEYWKGEDLPMRQIWRQKGGLSSKLFGPKFNSQKCPSCGYISRRFVCPHCMNWLPTEMIENGAEIISVIGSPSSGKTNYIVALIHQLRKYGYKLDLQVAPTQIYRDGHKNESTQNLFKDLETKLFKENEVLEKTATNKKDIPWIFKLSQQSTGKEIYLVFYDTAGEHFRENLKNNVKYLKESSGVIVILDTLSINYIKKILKEKGLEGLGGEAKDSLEEIQYALENLEGKSKYDKPFAFVFSKFDAVIDNKDELNFSTDEFMRGSKPLDSSYIKTGEFDVEKINDISQIIEATLKDEWDEGDFYHYAHNWGSKKNKQSPKEEKEKKRSKGESDKKRSKEESDNNDSKKKWDPNDPENNYKFFGVSAFGCMPDESNRMEEVKPYRVMDPLIWVLYKLGQFKIPTTD